MKAFISHAFGGGDEPLANALKEDLGAAGIDGYLAEKAQRYDLLISDKIKQEIDESEWLVAIITKHSQASASVHEEIGYALGKGIRVALMVEEGVEKSGVLVYGREYEVFTVPEFGVHSKKVAGFIRNAPRPPPRQASFGEAARSLLEKRRLLRPESPDFAQNAHFAGLYAGSLGDAEKPTALFTACPHDLGTHYDVTSPEFMEWAKSTARVEVDGRRIRVLGAELGVDIGTLLAVEKRTDPAGKNVLLYREFQSGGLLEWGTSYIFFGRNDRGKVEMHLCYMAGEFWAFLASVRLFYEKIGFDAPFSILLSVRNTRSLDLGNYGNKVYDDGWDVRRRFSPAPPDPATKHDHIQLLYTFRSAREMTDERIASVTKSAAKDICNAYGQSAPACYDAGGSFSWRLWKEVSARATGVGTR